MPELTSVSPDPNLDVTTDPALAKVLREEIRRVAESEDDLIRAEIAREILEGRMRASEIARYSFYAESLAAGLDEFLRWRERLSASEYAEYEQWAEAYMENVRAELG
jgi:hypothetical protein